MKYFIIVLLLIDCCLSERYLPTEEGLAEKDKDYEEILRYWKETKANSVGEPPVIEAHTFGNGDTTITGFNMNSTQGRIIRAFQGFRYADGTKRFNIAYQLDQEWSTSNFNAVKLGPICPQSLIPNLAQRENCLYANIYTPFLPDELSEKLLPVMVYIHGGYFVYGTGNDFYPNTLLNHDVVLVTINYRLGTLGFFTQHNNDAPGNLALYDQREALRWVGKHISDFGGDNNSVTVFGQSAGSASTSYMTIIADEENIHRAISESGSSTEVWSLDYDPDPAAKYVAESVGCLDEDNNIDMDCMRKARATELASAGIRLTILDRYNGLMGFRGVAPTIQGPTVTDDIILPKLSLDFYTDGDALDIAYMIGANKHEGSLVTSLTIGNYLLPHGYLFRPPYLREKAIEDFLHTIGLDDFSHGITNTLILKYCKAFDLGKPFQAMPCLIDMFGALFLKAGGWKIANYHSRFTNQSTYFYSFDYETEPYSYDPDSNFPYDTGVYHGRELDFLNAKEQFEGRDGITQERMSILWTNFAIYGEPTPSETTNWQDLNISSWIPYKHDDHNYILMRDEFIMQKEYTSRWTITVDEILAGELITDDPPALELRNDQKDKAPMERSVSITENDIDDIKDKRDNYMITMNVFIAVFLISVGIDFYLYVKISNKHLGHQI